MESNSITVRRRATSARRASEGPPSLARRAKILPTRAPGFCLLQAAQSEKALKTVYFSSPKNPRAELVAGFTATEQSRREKELTALPGWAWGGSARGPYCEQRRQQP